MPVQTPLLSFNAIRALDWAVEQASTWTGIYMPDSIELKNHNKRVKEARSAIIQLKAAHKRVKT